ncbi:MAG: VIT1/CCC1 transporter family protein [Acidimicrobiales bacterium]|nr:VIT1/CCC1 transporter family protein [Acidimicrobiales bacterium]
MDHDPSLRNDSLDAVYRAAHRNHQHRSVSTGGARAAVFGASDGLVSNVSLILGMAGASPAEGVVRLAGIAGLVAGAVSMAAGEYISMRAQTELYERELRIERSAQRQNPELEQLELSKIYEDRGMSAELAEELAGAMMRDPDVALEVHAREELGIDPDELGSPLGAAGSSFAAFAVGAALPLIPWLFTAGTGAFVGSVVLGLVGALVLGAIVGFFSGRSPVYTAVRQALVASGAAAVTYGIGSAIGVGI